jgi:MazG family protein
MRHAAVHAAAEEFAWLVEVMATLRSPEGCPWDRAQTFASLGQFVLEEAYEVVDAIERGDREALKEEIGDHIFEGVFLARIAADEGAFDVADSLRTVTAKLVRRHPHVFTDEGRVHDAQSRERAPTAQAALDRWDAQKAEERSATGARTSVLDGVPRSLPALLRAYKLGKRAASVGFDWERASQVVGKVQEEIEELRTVLADDQPDHRSRMEEELGDVLFAVANLARKLGIEPESALRRANDKFMARFMTMEQRLTEAGLDMSQMSLDALEAEWTKVKASSASSP